ncbi:transcription factor CP2-like protein 1 [Homarus americanus]|uniref:transcription factor CP2-like protein 1 n=1 Tax=Homarus americanus TaxID=6706 RepID=UPI001C455870|nr:transcription factor CP2-like protein 1 [Homarus americanus]
MLYWKNFDSCPVETGMGEPASGGNRSGEASSGRTRKRILDPLEAHEDDNNARRLGVFPDWQEAIKSIGVPNKKGFISMESSHHRHWESDEIDQGLAADFDDSLSGLGVDISTASYNMSEALLALPNVSQFKEEAVSPNQDKQSVTSSTPATFDESSQSNTTDRLFKLLSNDNLSDGPAPTIHQLLQQHLNPGVNQTASSANLASCHHASLSSVHSSNTVGALETVSVSPQNMSYEDNRFQYILGAATSIATKVNEESLSYLNQGQSYEIKVKKLGDLTSCKGKLYHSVIRVCFHERRLQYMERQQLDSWRQMRPGERILEVDIPLSYGVFDVKQDSNSLNMCEFDWDPTKEVGVYIKVGPCYCLLLLLYVYLNRILYRILRGLCVLYDCVACELLYQHRVHAQETRWRRRVIAVIQVETYNQTSSGLERLYVCACQIKVFKLKGADRKHKQDREKIMKRSMSEQEKYQPSCECTILTELSPEAVYVPVIESSSPIATPIAGVKSLSLRGHSPSNELKSDPVISEAPKSTMSENGSPCGEDGEDQDISVSKIAKIPTGLSLKGKLNTHKYHGVPLNTSSSTAQTMAWLMANRFNKYTSMFSNFSGTDILRLSRSDLIEMLGLADGLRLFYALHAKNVVPRLTVYVCLEHEQLYHAVYLENLTCVDFTGKLSTLMQITPERIHDVYLQGPSGIHILVTDEVVQNMTEESMLSIEVLQDTAGERFRLLLSQPSISQS